MSAPEPCIFCDCLRGERCILGLAPEGGACPERVVNGHKTRARSAPLLAEFEPE